ncbi:hypothetical protein [Trichothermofontia sp.]
MPKSTTLREYPPTSHFPPQPSQLQRHELEQVYLDLRQHYKGLSISRGQFAGKVQKLRQQLEDQEQQLAHVMQTLALVAQEKQELYAVLDELAVVSRNQKALIDEVKDEFEAVKGNQSLSLLDRFNRMMRAVYRLLNQEVGGVKPKPPEPDPDAWTREDPRSIGKALLDE